MVHSSGSKNIYQQIILSHDLYPEDCIVEAIHKYKDFCSLELLKSGENKSFLYIYTKSDSSVKVDQIISEFLNYLLDLSCRSFFSSQEQVSTDRA